MSSTSRSLTAARRQPAVRLRPLLLAMVIAGAIGPVAAVTTTTADNTLPTGMTRKQGEATVSIDDVNNVMTVTQTSSRAVWEASDFSVGAKAAFVNNATLGANTDTLIRVVGFNPSVILGPVTANNRLWLVNSNGLYVGSTGSITASSVMMSARDVNAAEVESGYATFMNPNQKASLLVDASSNDFSGGYIEIEKRTDGQPSILATGADGSAGSVVLMGSTYVYNKGVVQANGGGAIGIVAANDVTVQVGDSGFIELVPLSATATKNNTTGGRAVVNEGTIEANDGNVELIVAGAGNDGLNVSGQSPSALQTSVVAFGMTFNGVANLGTVNARVTRAGGSSSVLMESVGGSGNSVVGNVGTVDVSALNGVSAKGGNIDLLGPNVGNGGAGVQAQLLADGDLGGGNINLIVQNASGDISKSGRVLTNEQSLISADARLNGQGGNVRLLGATNVPSFTDTQTSAGTYTGGVNTSVMLQGTVRARGGTRSGDGGQIVASGTTLVLRDTTAEGVVTKAALDVSARSETGAYKAGWLKFYSPYVTIATAASLQSSTSGALLADEDLSGFLNGGANIEVGAFTAAQFYRAAIYVEPGAQITSNSSRAQTLRLISDDDLALGNGYSSEGINIVANNASMNVALTADLNGDGQGTLRVEGQDPSAQLTSVPGQASAQAVQSSSPVTIRTKGGEITLTGRSVASGDGSYGDAVYVRNALFDAQGGLLSIKGVGGVYNGEGSQFNNGITVVDSTFTAGDINIQGGSLAATGVSLNGVSLETTTNGQITINGYAQGDASANQHIGVDLDAVDVSLGASGRLKVTGLAVGGGGNDAIGVRVGTLSVNTTIDSESSALPSFTLVGQSGQSDAPGLQVNRYIDVYDRAEVPSKIDVVIGAKADAQALSAMTLGASYFGIAGRLNLRPLQVDAAGVISADHGTAIYIGPTSGAADVGTNFVVDPNLFSGQMGSGMNVVVGSSLHTGHITVADDVFNGSVVTTLQNQGVGASGITLGKQSGQSAYQLASASVRAQAAADGASAGVLNLLSAGNIGQTGPIVAQSLFVKVGEGATVNLSDPGNAVGTLLVSGGTQVNVTPGATPASTGTATAYDAGTQQFVTVTASANTPVTREPSTGPIGPTEAEIAATPSRTTVESTEALAELRTDVYVRGQFTRPQVCTPANSGGSVTIDVDADPLAQNWLQVRRSAQLSSCSGVRNDSNCSAF